MNKKQVKSYRKNFIIFPITFFVFGYLLIYLAVSPILSPLVSMVDMVMLDSKRDFNQSSPSLYDPNTQNQSQSETIQASEITFPQYGTEFGNIKIGNTKVDAPLFFGDGKNELKKGAGLYNGSFVPGYGKTILISAHNNRHFNDLKSAKVGETVTISTNYGTYTYEITETKITTSTDTTAYDLGKQEENLILYTCYPFDAIGLTPERYFVYGKYVSGPKINIYE